MFNKFSKVPIIILLLIIVLFFLKKDKETFLINDTKWINYRLGDIVYLHKGNKFDEEVPNYLKNVHKNYPDSIASEYLLKNKKRERDLDLLFDIISERIEKNNLNKEDKIILHLRIGDIIKNSKNNKIVYDKKYVNDNDSRVTKIDKLQYLLPILKEYNNEIDIYFGSHKNMDKKQNKANEKYLNLIKKFFTDNNIKYNIKSSGNPDEDFLNMCCAKLFIKSGGGYSRLISTMVKKRKNKVIDINNL
tara:strand:+ start:112 stop:852 length:741 start_codon:yes stop_codon:yes gene_type:complete